MTDRTEATVTLFLRRKVGPAHCSHMPATGDASHLRSAARARCFGSYSIRSDPRRKAAVAHCMPQVDQMIEEAEERADAELPPKLRLPLIRLKESPLSTLGTAAAHCLLEKQ